jgi:hypothetical protein
MVRLGIKRRAHGSITIMPLRVLAKDTYMGGYDCASLQFDEYTLASCTTPRLVVFVAERTHALLLVKVGERVIHVAVVGLVRSNACDDVADGGVVWQFVVRSSDERRLLRLPRIQVAIVDVLEQPRVRLDGLLLKVAHEAVTGLRRGEVRQEETVEEDTLRAKQGTRKNNTR